jgi:uncharacterized protein YdeI (YjbR/CyaY-like superfamily)
MKPVYFTSPAEFRAWLEDHHETAPELVVGFRKKATGKPSMTWPESVDQALCFGWIDGVRRRVDDERYTIRFTPRRNGSVWSAINIARVKELTAGGLMRPKGLEAFGRRSDSKSVIYSYEQRSSATLDPALEKKLKSNKKAWSFFNTRPPWYQRKVIYWIASAKSEETRLRRLEKLIQESAKGRLA